MVVIEPRDLGVEETLALRVLATARTIAPIDIDLDRNARAGVVAILTGVAQEALARGPRSVVSQRIGSAGVNYATTTSWFTDDDKAALRALCRVPGGTGADPVGSFPQPSKSISLIWPEQY